MSGYRDGVSINGVAEVKTVGIEFDLQASSRLDSVCSTELDLIALRIFALLLLVVV